MFVENYCTNLLGFGRCGNNGITRVVCECGSGKSMVCVTSSVKCGSGLVSCGVNGNGCGNRCGNRCSNSVMCVSSVKCGCSNSMVCNGNGLVDGDMVLVNHRGFDNLMDRVNLVGLGNGIRLGNFNGVGFGNMFLNNDFSLNGNGHGNRDLYDIFVHLKLGFNTGDCWGDNGVGPDRCSNSGDGNGISGCGSLVGGCRGNSKVGCGCSRDYWGCNGHGALGSLSGFSNESVSGCLANFSMLGISVSSLDSLGAHLDSFVSNNLVGGMGYCGSSVDVFLD